MRQRQGSGEKYVRVKALHAFNTDRYNERPYVRFHPEGAIVEVPESRIEYLTKLGCIRSLTPEDLKPPHSGEESGEKT
jgi:hypothetical protein